MIEYAVVPGSFLLVSGLHLTEQKGTVLKFLGVKAVIVL